MAKKNDKQPASVYESVDTNTDKNADNKADDKLASSKQKTDNLKITASDVNQTSEPAVKLFGKMLTFSRLKLTTNDTARIKTEIADLLGNTTSQIPVVLDSELEQDLPALLDVLWKQGLQPIGVVSGVNDKQAKSERLAIFPPEGNRIGRVENVLPRVNRATTPTAKHDNKKNSSSKNATSKNTITENSEFVDNENFEHISPQKRDLVHEQLLRSGQSINHVGGDLILTRSVNQGAEVITDHSLHIYGRAKGRLVAGATGDKHARIFCQDFNPSLVSVAGTYCLQGDIPPDVLGKAVQVSFVEGKGLVFQLMDDSGSTYRVAQSG